MQTKGFFSNDNPFFPPAQTKLKIGQPGDKYEKEADQAAYQVVSSNKRHEKGSSSAHVNHRTSDQSRPADSTNISSDISDIKGIQMSEFPIVQPFLTGPLAYYSYIRQIQNLRTKFEGLRSTIFFGQLILGTFNSLCGGKGQLRFSNSKWAKIQSKLNLATSIVGKSSVYSGLGFISSVPGVISTFLGAGVQTASGVLIPFASAEALLIALEGAAAAAIAILAEVLIVILIILAIIALIILVLYLLYKLIEAIVEAVTEAIEAMRNMPPIFWPFMLPLPGPIGIPVMRTKPANPRIPGGGQDVVRAQIKARGRSHLEDAHHVLPLFLGGTDIVPNVVPLNKLLHRAGHASLLVQPQMAIWSYSISLYQHPPPPMYFIAGMK